MAAFTECVCCLDAMLISVVLIEILMSAGEILTNVNLIFSESVECPKGGSNFSLGVLNTPLGGTGPAY